MLFRTSPLSLSLAVAAVAAIGLAAGSGCAPDPGVIVSSDVARDEHPLVAAADLDAIAKSELHVGGALLADDSAANVLASPHSIVSALAMVYAGARGDTATQMRDALLLPDENVHEAFDALDLGLAKLNEGDVVVRNANAVWSQLGFHFRAAYLDVLGKDYGAGVHTLDFAHDAETSRSKINAWVSYETEGKIPELFPKGTIDSATRLALTNAIYFHAPWATSFDAAGNHDFHAASGAASVPFMHVTSDMKHAVVDDAEAVELAYANDELSFLLVLPDAGKLDDVVGNVDGSLLADIDDAATTEHVDLTMPKLELRTKLDLGDELQELGMIDAFDGRADFSGIDGKQDLAIHSVVHDAWILVDEHGTTGAAATGV